MAFGIAARAGIAVPVPGAADTTACLEQPRREPEPVAQAEQLIEAGEPGTDDQRVELAGRVGSVGRAVSRNVGHGLKRSGSSVSTAGTKRLPGRTRSAR